MYALFVFINKIYLTIYKNHTHLRKTNFGLQINIYIYISINMNNLFKKSDLNR